jgi:hypothetical protein
MAQDQVSGPGATCSLLLVTRVDLDSLLHGFVPTTAEASPHCTNYWSRQSCSWQLCTSRVGENRPAIHDIDTTVLVACVLGKVTFALAQFHFPENHLRGISFPVSVIKAKASTPGFILLSKITNQYDTASGAESSMARCGTYLVSGTDVLK